MTLNTPVERRKENRYCFRPPMECKLSFPNNPISQEISVLNADLSSTGICIFSDAAILSGSPKEMCFSWTGIDQQLKIKGVTRWTENAQFSYSKQLGFKSGIQFLDCSPVQIETLKKLQQELALYEKKISKMAAKKQMVRQDRFDVSKSDCILKMNGRTYSMVDYNAFGVSIRSSDLGIFPSEGFNAELFLNGLSVVVLQLHYKRAESIEKDNYLIAFEIIGEPLNTEKISAMLLAETVVSNHEVFFEKQRVLPELLRCKVYELKDWLELLEIEVNALEQHSPRTGNENIQKFEEGICEVVSSLLSKTLTVQYDELARILKTIPKSDQAFALSFIRKELKSLYQAPFAERSFNKPLGYAGDYEVMNLIYRNQQEGKSLFAKCLHRYFVNEPAAKSVRNRIDFMIPRIKKILEKNKTARILSVASGPAAEIQFFLENKLIPRGSQVQIDLLDQDIDSLKYAKLKIQEILRKRPQNVEVQYLNRSIRDVIQLGLDSGSYDLIYALGVFDYLPDPIAQTCAKKLYSALNKNGEIIIGNFDIENPTRTTMELPLDWDLIYRTEQDIRKLFSKIFGQITVTKEPQSINLFCIGEKL